MNVKDPAHHRAAVNARAVTVLKTLAVIVGSVAALAGVLDVAAAVRGGTAPWNGVGLALGGALLVLLVLARGVDEHLATTLKTVLVAFGSVALLLGLLEVITAAQEDRSLALGIGLLAVGVLVVVPIFARAFRDVVSAGRQP